MTRLFTLIKLDYIMMVRNKIIFVALAIALLYAAILQVLPTANFNLVITTLIFTDPVMIGFLFIGAMVLFEKGGNTLQPLSVSPVRSSEYLWSKALTLTSVSVAAGLIMTIAGVGLNFNLIFLAAAIVGSSLLFIFIGFVGVSMIKTFNQYFIIIPLFLLPAFLPFLSYYGIADSPFFWLIPTQACLTLFVAAFEGEGSIAVTALIYALLYLPIAIYGAYRWALASWERTIRS